MTASDVQLPWKELIFDGEFRRALVSRTEQMIKRLQPRKIPLDDVKIIEIYKDYDPTELAEEVNSEFKIRVGRSFCLFEGELEDIPEQRCTAFLHEVITMLLCSKRLYGLLTYNHVDSSRIILHLTKYQCKDDKPKKDVCML